VAVYIISYPVADDNMALVRQTLNELDDLIMLFLGLTLLDQVNLVLHDDYMLQLHNLNGSQVLGGLRLWTRLIAGYKQSTCSNVMHNATHTHTQ